MTRSVVITSLEDGGITTFSAANKSYPFPPAFRSPGFAKSDSRLYTTCSIVQCKDKSRKSWDTMRVVCLFLGFLGLLLLQCHALEMALGILRTSLGGLLVPFSGFFHILLHD